MSQVRYKSIELAQLFLFLRKRLVWVILFATAAVQLDAQSLSVLSGKVVDTQTNKPVPFASIFLAKTMMGTNTKEDGTYLIEKIPTGKYELVVSSIGYKIRQIPISIAKEAEKLNIEMIEEALSLDEVVVKAKPINTKKWIPEFKKYFIGETTNARECTIINLDKVDLDYDEEGQVFTVSCGEPIVVENKALGYRVHFLLQRFTVNYARKVTFMSGLPRFEEMIPMNEGQKRKWQRERNRAYYGSLNHFIRSIKHARLEEDHFEVELLCGANAPVDNPYDLFVDQAHSKLVSKCVIQVTYLGEGAPQISRLTMLDGKLTIYDNGYYEDQLHVELDGYYAQNEKMIAEILPQEFQPVPKKLP